MTITATSPTRRTGGGEMHRIVAVARLHFVNSWTIVILPWMILGFILLVNLAVWWIVSTSLPDTLERDFTINGGALFIFIYMLVVAVQAINLTFPFALGYGVTRRDFYLGTSLAFVILSAMYSVGLTLLAVIEQATNGWGVEGRMFTVDVLAADAWYRWLFLYFVSFLFFFFVGAAIATVYVRWRNNGMVAFFAMATVAVVGLAMLATVTNSWPSVGAWFVANGVYGVATWSLVPTALAAVTGYLVLRRTTSTN